MIDQDLDQDPRYLADMDSLLDRIVKRTRSARAHLDKETPWQAMLAAHMRALDTTPEPEPEPAQAQAPAPALDVEPELIIHPNARRYKPVEEGPIVDIDRVAQLRSEGKTWRDIRGHMGINIHRMMADVRMWRPDILGPISKPKPEPEPEPEPKRVEHVPRVDLDLVAQLRSEGKTWTQIRETLGVGKRVLETDVRRWRPDLVSVSNSLKYKPIEEGPRVDLDLVARLRSEGRRWSEIRAELKVGSPLLRRDVKRWRPDLLGDDGA